MRKIKSNPVITSAFSVLSLITALLLFNNVLYAWSIPRLLPVFIGVFWLGSGVLTLTTVVRK